tara:strand:- start:7096 stop:8640 length:1545 start_codon:yes stop_codon:yes gene_type:complete
MGNKAALIILDGWGIGKGDASDGVSQASTPNFDQLINKHPSSVLKTFGENVGLPKGQMGNSEVGHLNIGAGRIVYQDLLKIDNAINDKTFFKHPQLMSLIDNANKNKKRIHLLGLVSRGGVHSSLNHLLALCELLKKLTPNDVFIHGITDGRDCSPVSGLESFEKLDHCISGSNIKLASVIGRYYAMDRDQRWERIKLAYDLMVYKKGDVKSDFKVALEDSYKNNVTDEFVKPIIIEGINGAIEENDVVICFNFRTDRCRQITTALTQRDFPDYQMSKIPLSYYTMTNYDKRFVGINVIYDKANLPMTLGEVLTNASKTQLRIAETEKYPHVTYFFSGGREQEFKGESRIVVNSPKVSTYDLKPEMSAFEVTQKVISFANTNQPDFICLNYANPDMVGHTGIPEAIIKACQTVDSCLDELLITLEKLNYSVVIIADHGNADKMKNEDGTPHTAHTVNLVPMIVINNEVKSIKNGILADVATTILDLMNVQKPKEMTGDSLLIKAEQGFLNSDNV